MTNFERNDAILFDLLKECKTLPLFLDQVFGFLSRRTDFYRVATAPQSSVGLPAGLAEQTVRQTFHKWQHLEQKEPTTAPKIAQKAPQLINKPRQFSSADSYNGAACDGYSWSQTLTELDLVVHIPDNTPAKQLKVTIESSRICVEKLADNVIIVEGELSNRIRHRDAIWSLDHNKLAIHVEKSVEKWWNRFFLSEAELDVSQMDCSRPFEELPEEAQAKIEELQWNQEQKRLGLPTSEEISQQNVLQAAWNAEGSPFSGPFDPNLVKFS